MKKLLLILFSLLLFSSHLNATINLNSLLGEQQELLTVDEAFKLQAEVLDDTILVKFEIAEDYYMYRERFKFSANNATLAAPTLSDGKVKDDPYFGMTEVYHNFFEASIPFSNASNPVLFTIDFQGCATDRLCYPPTSREVELTVAAEYLNKNDNGGKAPVPTETGFVSEQSQLQQNLKDKSILWNFFAFIGFGILLAFTPCVFPMMPIISGIIAGQGKDITNRKAFGLSLSYTQAMAIVYAGFGILVALAGKGLSGYLQSPYVIIPAAVIFVLLALSMFGFYELQLPSSLQAKLAEKSNNQERGSYLGAGIMGAISALIVSPCVTAPLIAILYHIASTGDILLGAISLYGLGIGMGIPLIIIGVTGGKYLPQAGMWMNGVKAAFGVLMLGVAIYLVKHLIPTAYYMYSWALLLIIPGYYLFSNKLPDNGWTTLFKGVGLGMMLYGALILIGGSMGNRDILQPLKGFSAGEHSSQSEQTVTTASHLKFEKIKTLAELEEKVAQAKSQGKTVMLDFFAEWCTACYQFEEEVFTDQEVIAALSNSILLQADVTANDEYDVELLEQFDVLGLPSIMFFDLEGNELPNYRATGFEDADVFVRRINAAFKQ